MQIYQCSFVECLKIINQDFGLGLDTTTPKPAKIDYKPSKEPPEAEL